jgi:hypothetical protein
MPIYEYYCPDNHKIYSFFAKTLAQGRTTPPCPDNPAYRLVKIVSSFAVTGRTRKTGDRLPDAGKGESGPAESGGDPAAEARMAAALSAMEGEFANIDENDPRAMGRMMRRMSELTGEKLDGEMEEVVRKLEEGADPDQLEEQLGGPGEGTDPENPYDTERDAGTKPPAGTKEARSRLRARRGPPIRDPKLYDYE